MDYAGKMPRSGSNERREGLLSRALGRLTTPTASLDDAVTTVLAWRRDRVARSIGLEGNASEILPELVRRNVVPDLLTDQTSAHDALNGYVPGGMSLAEVVTRTLR